MHIEEVCDGKADCIDKSDENKTMCLAWQCPSNRIKCANNIQCIDKSSICDGYENCNDKSDELCDNPCLKKQLKNKSIIRKCSEDNTLCIPVEQFCDRVIDCPDGSDEAGCSCEDWSMNKCSIGETNLCIYKHWILNKSMIPLCVQVYEEVINMQEKQMSHHSGLLASLHMLHYI